MTVEVRQLVVKSNVLQRSESDDKGCVQDAEEIKQMVLDECRRQVLDTFQVMKER